MKIPNSDLDKIISLGEADFLALNGANLFLTGGTGYIGKWILEAINYANRHLPVTIKVSVLSRNPQRFCTRYPHLINGSLITLMQGDIRDFVFPDAYFTHLIHAATDVVASSSALETFDVTVTGTQRALRLAKEAGVSDALLLSSGAVYGQLPDALARVPESYQGVIDITSGRSAYGFGKLATEWLGNTYSSEYGVSCKSARVFAQVGPYLELNAHFAVGNFIRDALSGQNLVIKGDGTPIRSYMYSTDLVVWLLRILVRGHSGTAYNVGSEEGVSICDLAKAVGKVADIRTSQIVVLRRHIPGEAPDYYLPDTSFARGELGLSISVPLELALKRTVDWYRQYIL